MAETPTQARPFGEFERTMALRYLGSRRADRGLTLVSIISIISIMLAVGVLIITMSVMNGFRETIVSRILGVNGHVYIDMVNRGPEERQRIIAAARAIPGVTHVADSVEGQVLATANGRAAGAYVRGITAENIKALPIIAKNIVGGSLDKFSTDASGDVGLMIGYRLASQLGVDENGAITLLSPEGAVTPFGVTPRLKAYAVGAIFNIGMAEYDSSFVYMPLAEAQLFFGKGDGVDRLELRLADPDNSQAIMRALRAKIGPDLFVSDWVSQNQSLVSALVVERNVMRLILMMVVLIAAMNIIAGLIMMVRNKTRDVAILRTIGATQGAILRIFIMSGMSVGVWGAFLGLAGGTLFCIYIGQIQDFVSWLFHVNVFNADVYSLSRIPAKVEPGEVALVGAWALLMSFLASIIPAYLGSRRDPVEAIRYE